MPTVVSSDDHYFHIRFAEKIFNNGFFESFRDFKSLYFTKITAGEHFIYYNFLFYLVLIPFTFVTPLYLGIKFYAIFIMASTGTILYRIIKSFNIKYSFVHVVLFFAIISPVLTQRLFLARPFVFAPVLLLLLLTMLYKRKYLWVFLFSFLYLFWHTATFFMPFIISVVFFVAVSLYSGSYNWRPILYTLVGTTLALILVNIINTGFFISIYDNIITVIKNITTGNKINIQEGNELYKRNFFEYFYENLILFTLYITAIVMHVSVYFKERKSILTLESEVKNRRSLELTLFLFSSLIFLAIFNVSFRFSDTFIFFAWFYVVFYYSGILNKIKINDLHFRRSLRVVFGVVLVLLFSSSLINLNDSFAYANRPATFEKVGNYLGYNLKDGEVVFNLDWSWFPQLYYYAPNQNYVIGLEPKLTYLYDKDMYWLWFNMRYGFVCNVEDCSNIQRIADKYTRNKKITENFYKTEGDKIAIVLTSIFKTNYIVTSPDYELLTSVLDNNKNFEKVVEDKDYNLNLYKVK
jgi:hypothetical protein